MVNDKYKNVFITSLHLILQNLTLGPYCFNKNFNFIINCLMTTQLNDILNEPINFDRTSCGHHMRTNN